MVTSLCKERKKNSIPATTFVVFRIPDIGQIYEYYYLILLYHKHTPMKSKSVSQLIVRIVHITQLVKTTL